MRVRIPSPTIELNWIYTSSGEYLGGATPAMVVESPEHYPARTFTVTIHAEEEAHEDESERKEKLLELLQQADTARIIPQRLQLGGW